MRGRVPPLPTPLASVLLLPGGLPCGTSSWAKLLPHGAPKQLPAVATWHSPTWVCSLEVPLVRRPVPLPRSAMNQNGPTQRYQRYQRYPDGMCGRWPPGKAAGPPGSGASVRCTMQPLTPDPYTANDCGTEVSPVTAGLLSLLQQSFNPPPTATLANARSLPFPCPVLTSPFTEPRPRPNLQALPASHALQRTPLLAMALPRRPSSPWLERSP